jgi:hypothetical protein
VGVPWKADDMRYDPDRKVYVDSKGNITPIEKWYQWDLDRTKRFLEMLGDTDPYPFKSWSSWLILAAVFLLLYIMLR